MIPRDPATRAAWARYERENAEARHHYRREPTASVPICEHCGRRSPIDPCRLCRRNPR